MALLDASGPGLPLEQLLGLLGDGRRDLRCPCHCFSSLSKINLDPREALVKPAIPAPSGAHGAPRRAPAADPCARRRRRRPERLQARIEGAVGIQGSFRHATMVEPPPTSETAGCTPRSENACNRGKDTPQT